MVAELKLEKSSARGLRIAIAVAAFNAVVTRRLQSSAQDRLRQLGLPGSALKVVWVPGALELPLACQALAAGKKFDAVIALGCVIRGETSHYDLVCQGALQGILRAGQDTGVPVLFGVVTCENLRQAQARAGGGPKDAGRHAAEAAVHMALLIKALRKKKAGR